MDTNYSEEQQPPPYQQEDQTQPPPNYEEQQTYEQPQTYETQQPQETNNNTYGMPNETNPEEPEDVVAQPTTTSGESPSKSGGSGDKDGDGFFGQRFRRLLTHSILMIFFSILAFDLWFDTKESPLGDLKAIDKALDTSFQDGWNLHAGGLFFMFIAETAVLVMQIIEWRGMFAENRWVNLVIAAVLWLGAFLYWVGGAVVAGSWNDTKGNDNKTSLAGIYFGEATYIGLLGVALGLDLFLNIESKSKRIRIYLIHLTALFVAALILFFSYATIDTKGSPKKTESAINTTAAGWFFVLVTVVLLFILEFIFHSHSIMATRGGIIWLVMLGLFLFSCFLTAIGYWSLCGTRTLKDAKSARNAYYVAYSFVVLGIGIIVAIDIKLGEFLPGGNSESSASEEPNVVEPTME